MDEEFIEVTNRSGAAIDLGGWRFSDGVDFTFPAGTVLSARSSSILPPAVGAPCPGTMSVATTIPAGALMSDATRMWPSASGTVLLKTLA